MDILSQEFDINNEILHFKQAVHGKINKALSVAPTEENLVNNSFSHYEQNKDSYVVLHPSYLHFFPLIIEEADKILYPDSRFIDRTDTLKHEFDHVQTAIKEDVEITGFGINITKNFEAVPKITAFILTAKKSQLASLKIATAPEHLSLGDTQEIVHVLADYKKGGRGIGQIFKSLSNKEIRNYSIRYVIPKVFGAFKRTIVKKDIQTTNTN